MQTAPPQPDQYRESTVSVLGLRTPILEAGPEGSTTAVVFLHGHPGSSRDWYDLLAQVGEFSRALAFDLPGFGAAEKPEDFDYSPGSYANFLAAILNRLGIERAHLVMHDLGGVAGILWAAAHPTAFRSAVIIDTGLLIGFRWHPLARVMRIPLIGELTSRLTTRTAFRAVLRHYNPQPRKLPTHYTDRLWADYDSGTRRAVLSFYRTAPPTGFERLVPLFRELDRPALVLWGQHDPAIPVEQAELQRQSFPSAQIVVLEHSGHWPFIDDPDQAEAHILRFLRQQLTKDTS